MRESEGWTHRLRCEATLTTACRRLKLPHFSSRSLRRCFITRAIEKGVDFKTLASWQGHRDAGVLIAKTYTPLRNQHSENIPKTSTQRSPQLSIGFQNLALEA